MSGVATSTGLAAEELDRGSGETLVLLHSSNTAGWMWGPQLDGLRGHHLIVPDLPGFGGSSQLAWGSVAEAARHVASLVAEFAPEGRAHLVGLSLGSSVALAVAAAHPDRVRSVFAASAALAPPSLPARFASAMAIRAWNSPAYWRGTGRSYGLSGEDLELFVSTGSGIRRQTAEEIYREMRAGTSVGALARVRAPVLATAGGRDAAFVRQASLARLREALPSARTAVAPGLHHHWSAENPQLFADAVSAWTSRGEVADGLADVR
ncbi:alpha/beta hydrolase [Herbiconiux sp. CPCC 203407]|uniref:Alpha/beta hydrolase n=1 Tax=Herbiconiux oxytropis TaxID=2970915 RepID=A0AA41XFL1_9MICO|nr:alpha/beta hydrolase [Herbiconiux oxytropis]MCS5724211.1 alpha/beta hydrolase [Herbiconiux oxytropis]MCS5727314.1 alpha/beta hydrolase [Herbiconiux oxytropis]